MPGLSFLAKKSYHPSNLSNVEQVWMAEQKEASEKKRLVELKKQIDEERQIDELRQLQTDSGLSAPQSQKVDWMYEGPMSAGAPMTDGALPVQAGAPSGERLEHLLGKEYKAPPGEDAGAGGAGDLKSLEDKPGSLWLSKTSTTNETFARLHEDPLLAMRQSAQGAQDRVLKNKMKMSGIRASVEEQLARDRSHRKDKKAAKKAKKKDKKDRKKERKAEKKRSKHGRRSGSSDDSDSGSDAGREASGGGGGGGERGRGRGGPRAAAAAAAAARRGPADRWDLRRGTWRARRRRRRRTRRRGGWP